LLRPCQGTEGEAHSTEKPTGEEAGDQDTAAGTDTPIFLTFSRKSSVESQQDRRLVLHPPGLPESLEDEFLLHLFEDPVQVDPGLRPRHLGGEFRRRGDRGDRLEFRAVAAAAHDALRKISSRISPLSLRMIIRSTAFSTSRTLPGRGSGAGGRTPRGKP